MRLTEISVRALKPPSKGVKIYTDDTLTGFGVRVSEGGTKSYVLTHGPRRERETIGRVRIITLQDARADAKRRMAEYTLGRRKPKSIKWDDAKREYLNECKVRLRPSTFETYSYYLDSAFRYGRTKVVNVSPHDLIKSLDRLKHAPSSQHHAFTVLRAFMHWAHRRHYLDLDPTERMQLPQGYVPRDRVLTNDELARIWTAAGDDTFGSIIKLLILTGQRRGEITQLKGRMVGAETITLPAALSKNKRQHMFPLGDLARTFLRPDQPPDEYFFKTRGKTTPFDGYSKCKPKLDKQAGVYDWTVHDLRRTFASGLASIGVSLPTVERLLNHISGSFGGIVGVYQRYDYLPEMQDAIERWERHVQALAGLAAG